MALLSKSHPDNKPGSLFVDDSCIDCDCCRWRAPQIFGRSRGQSVVTKQPYSQAEKKDAARALLACPTASIGLTSPTLPLKEESKAFPLLLWDNVYDCGYHSEKSFGATSYFIKTANVNILIDVPRFSAPLIKNLHQMGGVTKLLLTHIDDVADHEKFYREFNCERYIHEKDYRKSLGSPFELFEGYEALDFTEDLKVIPVPGHTKGHVVYLYRDKFLFSGDHLAWSRRLEHLYAFRSANWYNWEKTIESMEKLLQFEFQYILPGHGRRAQYSNEQMKFEMEKCIQWMKDVA